MRFATRKLALVGCICASCIDTKADQPPSDPALSAWESGAGGRGSDKPALAPSVASAGGAALPASAPLGAAGASEPTSAARAKTVPVAQAGSFAAGSSRPALQPPAAGVGDAGSPSPTDPAGDAGSIATPSEPTPMRAGDLVITELMIDPTTLPDAQGEWFELYNASATALTLRDCKLDDGVKTLHSFAQAVLIQQGEYATFARAPNPGFTPSATVALSLTNSADTLAIICAGIEIDRVSYDKAAGFAIESGVTLSLDPDALSAQQNDDASAWCAGQNLYNDDFGTPGGANPSCHAQPADSEDTEEEAEEEEPDAGVDAGTDAGLDGG